MATITITSPGQAVEALQNPNLAQALYDEGAVIMEDVLLVLHGDKDGNAPVAAGKAVAEGIAGARFVEFDSANHVPLADEPAWPALQREIGAFLRS